MWARERRAGNQDGPKEVGQDEDYRMKSAFLSFLILLALVSASCSQAYSAMAVAEEKGDAVEEEIWALEEAYFTNLYRANYEKMLAMVHCRFLGWPGNLPRPIDREESACFMKKLIPEPTSCTLKIRQAGIQVVGNVALTQYTLDVNCVDGTGKEKTQSSRITHTWVKEGRDWRLLGGMSSAL